MSKKNKELRSCITCGRVIPQEDYKKHRNMNKVLIDMSINSDIDLRNYCGICAEDIFAVIDTISDSQWRYNWIGSIAKLNIKRIFQHRNDKNVDFLQFVADHYEEDLTLELYTPDDVELGEDEKIGDIVFDKLLAAGQYRFKEHPECPWVFHVADLTIVKDNRSQHIREAD